MAWDLADLQGNMISLFLFGEAATRFAGETQADVFALLNPEIIDARGVPAHSFLSLLHALSSGRLLVRRFNNPT
jgi:predicted metalloprotease